MNTGMTFSDKLAAVYLVFRIRVDMSILMISFSSSSGFVTECESC